MVSGMQLMEKFLFKIAKQWIAGDTVDDALISAKNTYQTKTVFKDINNTLFHSHYTMTKLYVNRLEIYE